MSSPTSPPAGRYGGPTRMSRVAWAIAGTLVVAFFSWTAWVFATDPTSGIEWVAFETSGGGGTTSTVTFQISAPPGTPVTCILRTVDSTMGTNGWVVRDFAASDSFTTQYTEEIRAVSAIAGIDVDRCWKTGS